jgi:hypothetical protein
MLRILVILLLFVSFLFLARGVVNSWRENPIPPPPGIQEEQTPVPDIQVPIDLSSPVPQPLPDLHKGYVFNVDRLFEEKVEPEEGEAKEGKSIDDDMYIDIDSVSYTGSIISESTHKAIVSYSPAQPRGFAARRRTTRGSIRPSAPGRTGTSSSIKYATLETGDVFNGYKVISIDPEKIVFERDDEKIEKLLYDPEKKRLPAKAWKTIAERPPRGQPPRGQAPPRAPQAPAVNRRVTVGRTSAAEGAKTMPQPGAPGRPARPRQILPAAPGGGPAEEAPGMTVRRRPPRIVPPPQTTGHVSGTAREE